jgi:protein-disulfide isomerase
MFRLPPSKIQNLPVHHSCIGHRDSNSKPLASIFPVIVLVLAFRLGASAATVGEIVAEVDGAPITSQELEQPLASQLSKLQEQIYNLKRQRLDALINQRLLATEAARRRVSVSALLDAEVTAKVGLVTEEEIEKVYEETRGKFKGGESTVREQIRTRLQSQKLAARGEEFLRSLRSQAKIVVNLEAPPIHRVEVSTQGAPFKGPPNAPVTIVEFSDFHCPFCRRVLPTLTQIESKYGHKIRLMFRDFPIESLHPGATKAHEAARCANEQGKFWAYHDRLFDTPPKSTPEIFKELARRTDLDVVAFESCFESGKYQEAIKKDVEDGTRLGVTGTPAFFINGRLITGAQPFESFARIIDDELARNGTAESRPR